MLRLLTRSALACAVLAGSAAPAAAYLANNTPAPNFTKPQHLTGTARSLSEFRGQVVVLFETWYN